MDGCWEKERDGKGKEGMLGRDGKGWDGMGRDGGKRAVGGGWWVSVCVCVCWMDDG